MITCVIQYSKPDYNQSTNPDGLGLATLNRMKSIDMLNQLWVKEENQANWNLRNPNRQK